MNSLTRSGIVCIAMLAATLLAAESQTETVLESSAIRFSVLPGATGYELLDRQSGTVWKSNPWNARFGEVAIKVNGQTRRVDLKDGAIEKKSRTTARILFQPLPDQADATLTVHLRLVNSRTLDISYTAPTNLVIENVRVLDNGLWVTDADSGYVAVPVREGLMIPADSNLAFSKRFDTYAYEGCHMEMLGIVKKNQALMLTWDDPYVAADIKSSLEAPAGCSAKQLLATSLELRRSARAFQIHVLGKGDYVTIGKAYRTVARTKGYLVTWDKKLAQHPDDKKLFGAINFKLWDALGRQMSEDSKTEKSHWTNWTFEEAGDVAEHLKNDLKLDHVLFLMGGWIHRGYDNQHPDILPAAPECGGDEALARCSKRVRDLGYLFGLHDNYQDIYRDSPSWSEDYVMKHPDGSLTKGGSWAGGLAYLTCSKKALDLARRPQNLEAVRKLTGADAYFIDTTYASGLQECFDPNHPLTRQDDMKWKQTLSDYARNVFGVFGSECGREWAIPHSDFFEGFTGVSGTYYHDAGLIKSVGGVPIPLFELVYRDTIAAYGKYGYDIAKSAQYVDSQLLIGRPLNYHEIPKHDYWKTEKAVDNTIAEAGDLGMYMRANGGWAEGMHRMDCFVKNTYEIFSPLNELTATQRMTTHLFLSKDRTLQRSIFGDGRDKVTVTVNFGTTPANCDSALGGVIALPPYGFVIESRSFAAFCALNWGRIPYQKPALFTLRSQDGKPLESSQKIRVYHGFGDSHLQMPWGDASVKREEVLAP